MSDQAPLPELDDYDWKEVFKYANSGVEPVHGSNGVSLTGFDRENVQRVVALSAGENDGPDWLALVVLHDGRAAFVRAGCDYTGWG